MSTTVTSATSGPYTAVAQKTFAVTFQSASVSEIGVLLNGAGVDPSQYVFNRNADGTGNVVFTANQTGQIWIYSKPLPDNQSDFSRFGAFYPDQLNPRFDRLTRFSVSHSARLSRALKVPLGETAPEYPSAAAREGYYLTHDGFGVPVPGISTAGVIQMQSDISANADAIAEEVSDRAAAINAEQTGRTNADAILQANINAEVNARGAGDTAEANARSASDTALGARIDTETTARATAEGAILAAIVHAGGALGTVTLQAADRTILSNLNPALALSAFLTEAGREGIFVWSAANNSANVTADPLQAVYVAAAGDLTGASGAWVRKSGQGKITPDMFGAVRYNPAAEIDATVALQAFFRYARNAQIARFFTFDWSGEWMVTATLMASYDGTEPNVTRKFRCGDLRVPDLSRLPGNLPLDPVLDIAGYYQQWDGSIGVYPTGTTRRDSGMRPYNSRPIKRGVRIRACVGSTFGDIMGQCIRRDTVWYSSTPSNGFTLDGVVFGNSQNESCSFGTLSCVFGGSSTRSAEATALVASARTHGKQTSGAFTAAEVFLADTTGANGSNLQRTQLTVPSTADLEIYDLIKGRVELTPAIYGTIAADNATSTFTWSAGDPTAFSGGTGLAVGDRYPIFSVGPNANKVYRIVSFGGTSNRTITVTEDGTGNAPTSHAATADPTYAHNGPWHYGSVSCVNDATHVTVWPFFPDRINSTFHIVHGFTLRTDGGDLANSTFRKVVGGNNAGAVQLKGLYGCKVGTVLGQATEIGIKLMDPIDQSGAGFQVDHAHIGNGDGCDVPIMSLSGSINGKISAESEFTYGSCIAMSARATTNSQDMGITSLGNLIIDFNGYIIDWRNNRFDTVAPTSIDNSTPNREQFVFNDNATLTVGFDFDAYRLSKGHQWAQIHWTDSDGTSPDGTLTLNMRADLAALGWTFAGAITGTTGAFTGVTTSQVIRLYYLQSAKKIAVTRLSGV